MLSGRQGEGHSSSNNDEDAYGFYESEFYFEEDNQLFDNFVDASIQNSEKENLGTEVGISDELLSIMRQDEGDVCANSDDMESAIDSEEDDSNNFQLMNQM